MDLNTLDGTSGEPAQRTGLQAMAMDSVGWSVWTVDSMKWDGNQEMVRLVLVGHVAR